MRTAISPIHLFIVKIAGACNLNCTYCYVYNKGDDSYKERPGLMSEHTYLATLARIRQHCVESGQRAVRITFHGGEPCLIGLRRFDRWCEFARECLNPVEVHLTLQTNGTLLNDKWVELLRRHNVQVGISVDGPAVIHDLNRIDHRGNGSHANVIKGIKHLQENNYKFGILCVIPLGVDALAVHRHILSLGCDNINYLLPDFTHNTVAVIREIYGPTPVADFLIPVFEDWWANSTIDVKIKLFYNISRMILGGTTTADNFGNGPLGYIVIESDGSIEGLDCLRVCENRITRTGLSVHNDQFSALAEVEGINSRFLFYGSDMPDTCKQCPEADTCGGGYLPHRYSAASGFNNPSVWCADLMAMFNHIRSRLAVSVDETKSRKLILSDMSQGNGSFANFG